MTTPALTAYQQAYFDDCKRLGIEPGQCFCPCRGKAPIAHKNSKAPGMRNGDYFRYIHRHSNKKPGMLEYEKTQKDIYLADCKKYGIEYGKCFCGCGEKTTTPKYTDHRGARTAGVPYRYKGGHNGIWRGVPEYIEEFRSDVVAIPTPCWIWQRSYMGDRHGYGQLEINGRSHRAHRYIYERERGAIPEGLDLDHLCRVRLCVNPHHLEPVTRGENVRRGFLARLGVPLDIREENGVLRGYSEELMRTYIWGKKRVQRKSSMAARLHIPDTISSR